MLQKKMFKVLAMTPYQRGAERGTRWTRVGTAFQNRDESVNILLDCIPKNFELQLREFDEEDLRTRDSSDAPAMRKADVPFRASVTSAAAADATPF